LSGALACRSWKGSDYAAFFYGGWDELRGVLRLLLPLQLQLQLHLQLQLQL